MPRINVAITGSTESLERAFARASSEAKAFNVSIGGTAVNLRRLEPAMANVGRAITRSITVPTAAIGVIATKMGIDFNKQMLLIQTQAGASAGEVKKLSGEVLNLAKMTPQGPTELAQGLYHLESLGLRGAKAMSTLRIAALAAGMGIANLEDTTTALGGVVVTGIRGAQNYQAAMATLVATVGAGNVRMEDLAGAIGNVAPAAQAAGVSLPELGAAIATLTDRGFSADEATTRLRMSLALIQSPSEKARKALKDMGINADELGGILRQPNGLLHVLQMLNEGVQKVGATRGNRDLLAGFGGGRSGLGIQTLVGSLNQGLSSYQSKLADVSAGERKFAANQKAYLESPAYKLASAWSSVQVSLVKLGAAFAPVAVKLGQALALVADGFSAMPRFVKIGAGAILAAFAIGGPLLLGFAALIRAITTVRIGLAALGPTAAASATETEAAMAGIGAAASGATAEVGVLRAALASLGVAAIATAAATAAAVVSAGGAEPRTPSLNSRNKQLVDLLEKKQIPISVYQSALKRFHVDTSRDDTMGKLFAHQPKLAAFLDAWAVAHGLLSPSGEIPNGQLRGDIQAKLAHAAGLQAGKAVAAATSTPKGGGPGLDRGTRLDLAVSRASLAVAQGNKGAQQQLVAALKDKIDFDRKWIGRQEDLIRRGVGDAKQHGKIIQSLLQDETSAQDQINSIERGAEKDSQKKHKARNDALKKAAEEAKKAADAQKQALQQALDAAKAAIGELGQGPVANGPAAQFLQQYGGHLNAQAFTQDIRAQNNQFAGFLKNLHTLTSRGAPAGLTQALFAQGQSGMAEAAALAKASPQVLHSFLSQYERRQKLLIRAEKMEVQTPHVTVTAKTVDIRTDAHDRPANNKFGRTATSGRRR